MITDEIEARSSARRVALFPKDHPVSCELGSSCPKAVAVLEGYHVITFGHAGFNSPANNASGYRTEALARAAVRRYEEKGRRRRPVARGGQR